MERSKNDIWVGLLVLLGLASLLFLALKSANLLEVSLFKEQYQVTARFDDIGGLKSNAPIKSAGVVVGRVESISFDDETYAATATLNLDSDFVFPSDSMAKIQTSGLLGEQYIALSAGDELDNLQAGDRITKTQSAIVLESLISQFMANKASESE